MIEKYGRYYPDEYKEYAGCNNCIYQPAPLMMCEEVKRKEVIEPICSRWELKGEDNA